MPDVTITKEKLRESKKDSKIIDEENNKLKEVLSAFEGHGNKNDKINSEVLDKLKKKNEQKMSEIRMESTMMNIVEEKKVSINLAVIGIGQAGSRIAEEFHKRKYDVGVINTSSQDLKFIEVLPHQKLLLEGSLGGTGKDLELGREIFSSNHDKIKEFIFKIVDGNDMACCCMSLGGGTGASSVDEIVPLLFETGLPVSVICVLPKHSEDSKSKFNAVETLAKLARMASANIISSLVVVDNARIENIYGNLSQTQFWQVSNDAIVEPWHLFNNKTAQASQFTSLDPSDFGKILSCGDCSIYGVIEVKNYMEETALAEAIIESLNGNMLAEGFDLTQTRTGGVIIIGSYEALNKLPAVNIDYAFHIISEQTNGANIFQGIYADSSFNDDVIRIYSWFAGLGLPHARIENLKNECKSQMQTLIQKEKSREEQMTMRVDEDKVISKTEEIHSKIDKKNSGFNKLQNSARVSLIDKRRKAR